MESADGSEGDHHLGDSDADRLRALRTADDLEGWLREASQVSAPVAHVSATVEKRRKYFKFKTSKLYSASLQGAPGGAGGAGESCKRKFKEFRALQSILQTRFFGALIPPLPKTGKALSDERTVEALELFLSEVARNPLLRSDAAFADFFKPETAKFKEDAGAQAPSVGGGSVEQWNKALNTVPLPEKTTEFVTEVSKELASLQLMYSSMREHVAKVQSNARRQAKDALQVSKFYEAWREKEAALSHLHGRASDALGAWGLGEGVKDINMPAMLASEHAAAEGRADALDKEAEEILTIMLKTLDDELWLIAQLSALGAQVKAAVTKHVDAAKKKRDLDSKLKGLEASSLAVAAPGGGANPNSTAKAQKKEARLSQRVGTLGVSLHTSKAELKRRLRGFILETDRYSYERTARTAAMLHRLSELQETHLQDKLRGCQELLKAIPAATPAASHLACIAAYRARHDASAAAQAAAASLVSPTAGASEGAFGLGPTNEEDPAGSSATATATATATTTAATASASSKPEGPSKRDSMRVMFDFRAEEHGEVSLAEGELVEVVEQDTEEEEGWCQVKTNMGDVGLVPVSYLATEADAMDVDNLSVASPVGTSRSAKEMNENIGALAEPAAMSAFPPAPAPASASAPPADAQPAPASLLNSIKGFNKGNLSDNSSNML